jgi:predicted AAA+ superfamily ATPase
MIRRHLTEKVLAALADTPVVLINGPRQAGKSTLVRWLVENKHPARYLTLDDVAVLAAARQNPSGFLSGLEGNVAIDEVQRAPDLFLAMKTIVDRNRTPGMFLLTGSANVSLLPRMAESLAGRMEILTLWPFSQSELEGTTENVADMLFGGSPLVPLGNAVTKRELIQRIIAGGYPEVQQRTAADRRDAWFRSYVTTILQRDIRDISNIDGLTTLPRLLSLLAARATNLINFAEIATSSKIPQTTFKRYFSLLQTTFLVHELPAWSVNISKRLIKTPKLFFGDTGLMTHLLGANVERISDDSTIFGRLLENFVVAEIIKHCTWSQTSPSPFYMRTAEGNEIDLILERRDGSVVGMEVKASASVTAEDFRSLRYLGDELGKKFIQGVVVYTGSETVSFGKKLAALPVGKLWQPTHQA